MAIDLSKVREDPPEDIDELVSLIRSNEHEKQVYVKRIEVFVNWLKKYQSEPAFIREHADELADKFQEMTAVMARFSEQEYPALAAKIREMRKLMATANIHFHGPQLN